MKQSAILLARVIAYVDVRDLTPLGHVYFPDLVKEIAQRYQFQKFPQTIEEHDLAKGVEFLQGKFGSRVIQKFVIWDQILVLETRTNTDESKVALEEILQWGTEKFGLDYKPEMIRHFAYISDVSFYSDAPLLGADLAVDNLRRRCNAVLSDIWKEPIEYLPLSFKIGHDPQTRKNGIASFSLERRAGMSFSENKYFSEAPLPTDIHLQFLEKFEAELLAGQA